MVRLTATFQVALASPLFVNRPPQQAGVRTLQALRYPIRIDESEVEVALVEIHHAMTEDDRTIWAVPHVRVSVSQSETVAPPPVQRTAQGGRDFRDRRAYFRERDAIYRGAAIKALHRLVRFFKYRQAHALLRYRQAPALRRHDSLADFMNDLQWTDETWTDETGQEFPSGSDPLREFSIYGIELDNEVGMKALVAADEPALQQALTETPLEPEPYEELLSDARAALFQGGLRRAILELAMSCEVETRHVFLIKASMGGYEGQKILVLLDREARQEFGQSFKDVDPTTYKNIDHLFRCRNQIVHWGKRQYKDDQGCEHTVDQATVKEWFKAADRLFHWLRRMRP